jgi:RIO-like serine/threonine protein kinase
MPLGFALRTEEFTEPIYKLDVSFNDRLERRDIEPQMTLIGTITPAHPDVKIVMMDGHEYIAKAWRHAHGDTRKGQQTEYLALLDANEKGFTFVPQLIEVGEDYFVQEKVEGDIIDDYLIPPSSDVPDDMFYDHIDSGIKLLSLYADAIVDLQKAGIYHCDPHAGNAIVTRNGDVVGIDFDYATSIDKEIGESWERDNCIQRNRYHFIQGTDQMLRTITSILMSTDGASKGYPWATDQFPHPTKDEEDRMRRYSDVLEQIKDMRSDNVSVSAIADILKDLVREYDL